MLHVVCALIQRQGSNQVLSVQRPLHKVRGGYWEFPGGKVHDGELPESALRREIWEELKLDILHISPFTRIEHQYNDVSIRLDGYLCKIDTKADPLLQEHIAMEWVNLTEAQHLNWSEADLKILELYLKAHEDSTTELQGSQS